MFTMSAQHLAGTLAVTRQRERERAIRIVESHLGESDGDETLRVIVAELRAGVPAPRTSPPAAGHAELAADGLPAERERPDTEDMDRLARRLLSR